MIVPIKQTLAGIAILCFIMEFSGTLLSIAISA